MDEASFLFVEKTEKRFRKMYSLIMNIPYPEFGPLSVPYRFPFECIVSPKGFRSPGANTETPELLVGDPSSRASYSMNPLKFASDKSATKVAAEK